MKKALLLIVLISSVMFGQVEVSQRMQQTLQNTKADEYVYGFIYFRDQVDIRSLDEKLYREKATLERRAFEVITALQSKANETQESYVTELNSKAASGQVFTYQRFWIANMISVIAKPAFFYEMMTRAEVSQIDLDTELLLDAPTKGTPGDRGIESVEAGVKIINAHKLWEMGITGQGRLLMGIDTGVDYTHPQISAKWRGTHVPSNQAWFDPSGSTTPSDCDNHGTHTMGTMVGSIVGDTIGVAINAEWIAAKTICSSPHTSNSIAAFQWAMNPDNNATTINDMPDAISNSWYDPDITDECTGLYKQTFDALEAAGIAVVFSAGNSGPNSTTITKPKNINTDETNVFSVANIEGAAYLSGNNNPIASSSSRGPSTCGGTGSLLYKPEVSAPGTDVRSSVIGGGYDYYTGTSMACPHVVGAITLLRQAFPTLTGKQIKLALYNTAKDLGTAGEDNNYGKGLIDCYAAFLSMGTPDAVPPTDITDLTVIEQTSQTLKLQWTAPSDTSVGGVVSYDVRYSTTPINDTTAFNNATVVPFIATPKPSGSVETVIIEGLNFSSTYYFAVRSKDVWANWSGLSNSTNGTTLSAPVISVTPPSIGKILGPNSTVKDTVYISNISVLPSTLDYTAQLTNSTFPTEKVSLKLIPVLNETENSVKPEKGKELTTNGFKVKGAGGPDNFGYKWIDSDAPNGPTFEWNDISTTGTLATNWVATGTYSAKDEGYAGPINLGFDFKYYGVPQSKIYCSSNGFITFSSYTGNMFTNATIPNAATPNNYIAPYWDDLDGKTNGKVYYKAEADKFIVQYTDWSRYTGNGTLTFQVHLYKSGKIMVYYKEITATVNDGTVGIENGTGTDGLLMGYNTVYAKTALALKISADPEWLVAANAEGTLTFGTAAALELTFKSEDFPEGLYTMDLQISSNDPQTQTKVVPVSLQITDGDIPVELTSFTAEPNTKGVVLAWSTATETNNSGFSIERKSENTKWQEVSFVKGNGTTTEKSEYQFVDVNLSSGKYSYRLKQVDYDGQINYSNAVEVDVVAPNEYTLEQNYPNPFNPTTVISYSLPEKATVKIAIYNSIGELVMTLVNESQEAGVYQKEFNASSLSSGTYIYRLSATGQNGTFNQSKKMQLIK